MDSVLQISKIIDSKVQGGVNEVGRKIHDKVESMENIVMNIVDSKLNDVTRAMAQNVERKIESLHIEIDAQSDR